MADGSSQTIDRIQVEFSTNISTLLTDLQSVSTQLSATSGAFSSTEAASQAYATTLQRVGTQMDYAATQLNQVNTAATNTGTAIGRINTISNNAYVTFNRLAVTSTSVMQAISNLTNGTDRLSKSYTTAESETKDFTKTLSKVGTTANTVTTQINRYSKAISTAGDESKDVVDELGTVTGKTGETEGAMSKLNSVAGKLFAGFSAGTLLTTLDKIIQRAEDVSEAFQDMESDVAKSLGNVSQEISAKVNGVAEDLLGSVPATQNEALATGAALLEKELPELSAKELQSLLQEYASYADLWGMSLTDLISSTQKLFYKYDISTPEQMEEALGKINAVYNLVPDVTPSETISLLNDNRMAIGANGWSFDDALSRTYNAGRDHAMSKFEEYLSALQNVKSTKAAMFSSDEEFAAWIRDVNQMVRDAGDESAGAQIVKEKYDIWGNSAVEIAKYLQLTGEDIDRTDEILAKWQQNGTGYQLYLKTETDQEKIARADSQTSKSQKELGDTVLDTKAKVALQTAYTKDMYDVVSINLGDLTEYVSQIPLIGEALSPITNMLTDYVPEINIKTGMSGTAEEFIDKYESRLESGDYAPFDETYYLAYRTLADKLQVDYSDLKFTGEDAASVRQDLVDGLYTDLILRVKAARNGEDVQTLADVTSDVIDTGTADIHIDSATFTGPILLPDGTTLSGTELDQAGGFDVMSMLGIGRASAADDVVFNPDWNGLDKTKTEGTDEQLDMNGATEGIENMSKATEEASDVLAPFTTDVLAPMNTELATQGTNLTYNYDATVLLNDTSTNVTVPTVQTETTYVAALAQEYWNLYYAKLAAASV